MDVTHRSVGNWFSAKLQAASVITGLFFFLRISADIYRANIFKSLGSYHYLWFGLKKKLLKQHLKRLITGC